MTHPSPTRTAAAREDLVELIGATAAREYDAATASSKPALDSWIDRLRDRDDNDFMWEASSCILSSALVNSWRGNWEDDHCKASACHHEAQRRYRLAGHDDDCRGDTLYSRAFVEAWASQGHSRSAYPPKPCTCSR